MNKLIFISLLLLAFGQVFGQTIFDIEVDEIYLDDGDICFINRGESNTYSCELIPVKFRDYHHELILSCEKDNNWEWSDNPERINFDELIEFKNTSELNDLLSQYKFARSTNSSSQGHNSYIQLFNDDLYTEINFENYNIEDPDWQFTKADFIDYVYIRINQKYLIIALVYEDEPDPAGFIIPKKDETLVVLQSFCYYQNENLIDTIQLQNQFPIEEFYRIKETSKGYTIVDKLFQEQVIEKVYNNINIGSASIQLNENNQVELYGPTINLIEKPNCRAAYDSLGSIQCLFGNQIKWVDYDLVYHDTFPIAKRALCGTISSTDRIIESKDYEFYESFTTGYWGDKRKEDSILIISNNEVKDLSYLTNEKSQKFNEYSDLDAVFSFPYSYYILDQDDERQLISIKNLKDKEFNRLKIFKDTYRHEELYQDSINALMMNLKDEIVIEVIFTGDFEAFGYNHPIKFKEGDLYGYFPQNANAKYKRLEKFNFFFAELETKDGRLGWIDVYGNEYFRNE